MHHGISRIQWLLAAGRILLFTETGIMMRSHSCSQQHWTEVLISILSLFVQKSCTALWGGRPCLLCLDIVFSRISPWVRWSSTPSIIVYHCLFLDLASLLHAHAVEFGLALLHAALLACTGSTIDRIVWVPQQAQDSLCSMTCYWIQIPMWALTSTYAESI